MQNELDVAGTLRPVQILGVNESCCASGNATITAGRDLPWLQEGQGDGVWAAWKVVYRDVFVVDHENKVVAIYNLTSNDLGVPANYAALKKLFVDAANAP
jgi:hypothetical protein